MQELERTYLLKELPAGLLSAPKKELLDIYLPAGVGHAVLRIRKAGDNYEITKKQPLVASDASAQMETTIKLTAEEYRDLALLPGKRIEKIRYYYKEQGIDYELDVFEGGLTGLILVDVEFKTMAEKDRFVAPSWCLVEVTQEEFIAGGKLCGKTYADVESRLNSLDYTKIMLN